MYTDVCRLAHSGTESRIVNRTIPRIEARNRQKFRSEKHKSESNGNRIVDNRLRVAENQFRIANPNRNLSMFIRGGRTWAMVAKTSLREPTFRFSFPLFPRGE